MIANPEPLQVPAELWQMVDLYVLSSPQRVLEVGTWQGGTLREWLVNAAPEAEIFALDLEHPNEDAYMDWMTDSTLTIYRADSQEPAGRQFIVQNAPYDWVFIDADHGYGCVSNDVQTCLPLIREGGHLVLHDIVPPKGDSSWPYDWYGPGKCLDELEAAGHRVKRIVDQRLSWGSADAHGIGVVYL